MSTFDERLDQALKKSGVTRSQLAKALGITPQAVTAALSGNTRAFTASNNATAAKVLGVDANWLATGEGSQENPQGRLGPLSTEEADLIELLRALPTNVRQQASSAARSVATEYLQHMVTLMSRGGA